MQVFRRRPRAHGCARLRPDHAPPCSCNPVTGHSRGDEHQVAPRESENSPHRGYIESASAGNSICLITWPAAAPAIPTPQPLPLDALLHQRILHRAGALDVQAPPQDSECIIRRRLRVQGGQIRHRTECSRQVLNGQSQKLLLHDRKRHTTHDDRRSCNRQCVTPATRSRNH